MLNFRKNPRVNTSNRAIRRGNQTLADIRILTAKGGDHRTRACGRNLVTGRITLAARRPARRLYSFGWRSSYGADQGAFNEIGEPIKNSSSGRGSYAEAGYYY